MQKTILEIEDYSFTISKKNILKNISFTVLEGEYLSIIGPNGAGKTTLLKCLDRIYTGGDGTLKLYDKTLNTYNQRNLAKFMSYVPQADSRFFPFTVHEFVIMGRYPHLSPFSSIKKTDEDLIHKVLSLTGTAEFADRYLNTLSGGERQKVFIAGALVQEAKILLLDEPTTFLDPKHQVEIYNLLRRLNREYGITIISVTHDINSAVQWSDRILALKEGTIAFYGRAEDVMNNKILKRIYKKPFLFVKHPQTGIPVIVPDGKKS